MTLTVATWNVNGIRARAMEVRDWIERGRPDVVCLQELKASPGQIPSLLLELPGYWNYWHGERAYSGVSLHVRKEACPVEPAFSHPDFDYESRIVSVALPNLTVASVYVPNGGKDFPAKMRFLESMERFASDRLAAGSAILLAGDVNIARAERDVHPKERKPNAIGQLPEERALFERILSAGLVDVGRALDPDNEQLFTWWAPWRNLRQRNIGWRLDYVLASPLISQCVTECRVLADYGTSDHAPVVATFEPVGPVPGNRVPQQP